MTSSRTHRPAAAPHSDHAASDWQEVLRLTHDINNLLGAVVGYTEMLAEDLPPNTSFAKDLHLVQESARRASALVAALTQHAQRARPAPSPRSKQEGR